MLFRSTVLGGVQRSPVQTGTRAGQSYGLGLANDSYMGVHTLALDSPVAHRLMSLNQFVWWALLGDWGQRYNRLALA